jgi:hypothetical protein
MSEFTDGLRKLADFLESQPELQQYVGKHTPTEINLFPPDDAEVASTMARAFGTAAKKYGDTLFYLSKEFGGGLALRALFAREAVCVKRVVGQRVVPAEPEVVIPAKPERVEDIIEWDCAEPLLEAAK